jgi:HSP20 family molecular chaperone IbpA
MTTEMTLATGRRPNNGNGRGPIVAKPNRELTPTVDVFENEDELLLLADMPGATAESVAVNVESGQLTIEAQRTVHGETVLYRRTFQLPGTIDAESISAELRDGTLHVHLKKSEKAKRRVIPVRTS